jgi:hypothetical protein
MLLRNVIKLMTCNCGLVAYCDLTKKGCVVKAFSIVNNLKFSFIVMFTVGSEKSDKSFGAGFQG